MTKILMLLMMIPKIGLKLGTERAIFEAKLQSIGMSSQSIDFLRRPFC
jgi:hypothetical protein